MLSCCFSSTVTTALGYKPSEFRTVHQRNLTSSFIVKPCRSSSWIRTFFMCWGWLVFIRRFGGLLHACSPGGGSSEWIWMWIYWWRSWSSVGSVLTPAFPSQQTPHEGLHQFSRWSSCSQPPFFLRLAWFHPLQRQFPSAALKCLNQSHISWFLSWVILPEIAFGFKTSVQALICSLMRVAARCSWSRLHCPWVSWCSVRVFLNRRSRSAIC